MFKGEYRHKLDKKGRIVLPSELRDVISEKYMDKFVVTKWLNGCLAVFSEETWKGITVKLKNVPLGNKDRLFFARTIFAHAADTYMDRQGRLFIPFHLRGMLSIGKDVVILGLDDRIEIWDGEKWGEYQKSQEKSFEDIAQGLGDFGF